MKNQQLLTSPHSLDGRKMIRFLFRLIAKFAKTAALLFAFLCIGRMIFVCDVYVGTSPVPIDTLDFYLNFDSQQRLELVNKGKCSDPVVFMKKAKLIQEAEASWIVRLFEPVLKFENLFSKRYCKYFNKTSSADYDGSVGYGG